MNSNYDASKLRLVNYSDLEVILPPANPIEIAFKKTRNKNVFLSRPFFLYEGSIHGETIDMGLDKFHPNALRALSNFEPHVYPIVAGSICVDSAYFDGYVLENFTARNAYLEFRQENIDAGCGGMFSVGELLFANRRNLSVLGVVNIDTFVIRGESKINCQNIIISRQFEFPIKGRNEVFENYTIEQIAEHFSAKSVDDVDRIQRYFSIDLNAMLPLSSVAGRKYFNFLAKSRIASH